MCLDYVDDSGGGAAEELDVDKLAGLGGEFGKRGEFD